MPVSERLKDQTKTRPEPSAAPAEAHRLFTIYSSNVVRGANGRPKRTLFDPVGQQNRFDAVRSSAQRHGTVKTTKAKHRGLHLVSRPASTKPELVDVSLVAFVFLHLRNIFRRVIEGPVGPLGYGVQKGQLHVLGHAGRVAADVKVGSAL